MVFKGVVRKVYPYELGRGSLSSGDLILFQGGMAIVTETPNTIKLQETETEVVIDEDNVEFLQELALELSQENILNDPILFPLKYDQWKTVLTKKLCDNPVEVQFVLVQVIANKQRIHVAQVLVKKYNYTYTEMEAFQMVSALYNELISGLPADIAASMPSIEDWWNKNKNITPIIAPVPTSEK